MSNRSNRKPSTLRRTIAGLAAAGAIALGGVGTVSTQDAEAAGVRQTYAVQASAVQAPQAQVTLTPKRTR